LSAQRVASVPAAVVVIPEFPEMLRAMLLIQQLLGHACVLEAMARNG